MEPITNRLLKLCHSAIGSNQVQHLLNFAAFSTNSGVYVYYFIPDSNEHISIFIPNIDHADIKINNFLDKITIWKLQN